jgi:UDP-glucose 4-epimerase
MRRERCSGNRGWVGDAPRFTYSTAKVTALGWRPKLNSLDAVRRAVGDIAAQER